MQWRKVREQGAVMRNGLLAGLVLTLVSFISPAQDGTADFANETKKIADVLELGPGMMVADVGAGDGRYSVFLSGQVGASGRIYATEIDQEKVDAINKSVAGKSNVTVLLGKQDSTGLPDQCCDRILLRRVYHHLHQQGPMLKSLLDSLKPGGVLAIVDFLPRQDLTNPDGTPDDHEHGTSVEKLIEQVTGHGFELVRRVEGWPSRVVDGKETDYCVLFRRPAR